MKSIPTFEAKSKNVNIFLLPKNYLDRKSFHPVESMNFNLEKEAKSFVYQAGYKKPTSKMLFEDRKVNVPSVYSIPLKNSYIKNKHRKGRAMYKTVTARKEIAESTSLKAKTAENELSK